ncbi:helix-turn-helix domain-containing protein [Ferrimonas kyonanensis]|uniref:helix-turn-helix domain-containing protein n=1 Tax=Ferrimonas kyonanensis TaxID=364763 RepID=UPI000486695A|nr:helix-turn-helix transcriptional regulator [Ferrimonas kyonanensis]
MMGDQKQTAEYLKGIRLRARISPTEMAEKIGVSRRQIYYIEEGDGQITVPQMQQWIHACKPSMASVIKNLFPQFQANLHRY